LSFAYETSCFSRHLDEAIQLNESRKNLYGELTNGESDEILERLINHQEWGKYYGYYYDWRAEKYQESGIPLLCEEFVSMELTPPFIPFLEPKVKINELPELPLDNWDDEFSDLENFEQLAQKAIEKMQSLDNLPDYYCMTRHFLSSIARSARLAPAHIEKSKQADLASPRDLLLSNLKAFRFYVVMFLKFL
jgi:hypothetical protein